MGFRIMDKNVAMARMFQGLLFLLTWTLAATADMVDFSAYGNLALTFADIKVNPNSMSIRAGTEGTFQVSISGDENGTVYLNTSEPGVVKLSLTSIYYSTPGQPLITNVSAISVGPGSTGLFFSPNGLFPTSLEACSLYITVFKSDAISILAAVIGWIYFVAWSISFYPQIYINWKRKSVVGLSLDFVTLNTLGFLCYSVFNIGFFFIPSIREAFLELNPGSIIQVESNDVAFGLHALAACLVTAVQCCVYERGTQSVSKTALSILTTLVVFCVVVTILGATAVISWLEQLKLVSYVKLAVTAVKYVPQAVMNYRRKSTVGWSIGNILLDFTGGVFSFVQMLLLSYNKNAWNSIFGNPTKLGLSILSIGFDLLFMVQHYILYKDSDPYSSLDDTSSGPGPSTREESQFSTERKDQPSSYSSTQRDQTSTASSVSTTTTHQRA